MRAAVVTRLPATAFDVGHVPTPEVVDAEDVLVQVSCCGVCGTDLHILAGRSYTPELPFVLGHEPVGTVSAVGPAVDPGWIGRRVTITLFDGNRGRCGLCRAGASAGPCQQGDDRLCPELRALTGVHGAWGAFAEVMRVKGAQLVAVPDDLGDHAAATVVDAGATAFNAVRRALEYDCRWPVVTGAGAVGTLVAEALAAADRPPLVVEPNAARRRALERLGHRVLAEPDEVGDPIDCVLECSGSPEPPVWSLARLAPRGVLVLAGYAVVPELDLAAVSRKELRIVGVRSGARRDLEAVLDHAATGRVRLPSVTSWPLARIDEAFEALRRGDVSGKAVIDARHAPQPERHACQTSS